MTDQTVMAAPAPGPEHARPHLTVREIAAITRVSKTTVYRLIRAGELEAIRAGRTIRVPEQALTKFLRIDRQSPPR